MNWEAALAAYDRDLRARGSAERTRRAYGVDLGGFAEWAGGQGLDPGDVRHRDVRRYGAGLSNAGAAPATVARKLAAIRGLYGYLVRTERVGANPAELVSSPKRSEKLPTVLSTEQMRSLLERIPARTPLEPALRGDRQPRRGCARLRDRAIARPWQGAEGADPAGGGAGATGAAALPGEGQARAPGRSSRARPLPLQERPPPLQLRRHPPARPLDARSSTCRRRLPART
jgi:hypothetical protein